MLRAHENGDKSHLTNNQANLQAWEVSYSGVRRTFGKHLLALNRFQSKGIIIHPI